MLFGLFKSETTHEMLNRSVREMDKRIIEGLREKDSNYGPVYYKEMKRLSALQSNIISPPWYIPKKENYRNEKISLLKKLTEECKKFFVENIDNRLKEADEFVSKVDNNSQVNKDSGGKAKTDFLNEAANVQGTQGIRNLLRKDIQNPVCTKGNPSVFQKVYTMKSFIKNEKSEKEPGNETVFLNKIHQKITEEIEGFNLDNLLNDKVKKNDDNSFEDISGIITSLQSLNDCNPSKKERKIREMVTALQLNTVENSFLRDILRDADVPGGTGMDFMTMKYPDILEDVIRHKAFVKLDRVAVESVGKKGLSVLNWQNYAELNVRERTLSCAVSEFGLLKDKLTREYKVFKTAKKNEIREKTERRKTSAREINNNLEYLFRKTDQNRQELVVFDPIGIRLRRYTKFLNSSGDRDLIKTVGEILKNPKECDVNLNLEGLEDFSYLMYSSAGDIIRRYDNWQRNVSVSGIRYLIQKDPDLMDQLMAYVLLSQLEKEVNDYGGSGNITALDKVKFNNLMNIKRNINIDAARESLKRVREQYDEELGNLAEQTPELYINYRRWYNLFNEKKPENKGGISEEDFRTLDTNNLDQLGELQNKYSKDRFLKTNLEYRKKVIEKIQGMESDRSKQKDGERKQVLGRDDAFWLEDIDGHHERQKTLEGCWSVVLSDMLKYESVDLKQDEIRAYRAMPSYGGGTKDKYRESYEQNTGAASNIACHMNLIARVLPNTALHRVYWYGPENNPIGSLKGKIRDVVKEQGKPLGIAYGGHYRLIVGLDGERAKVYDPLQRESIWFPLDIMVQSIIGRPIPAEMFWFENISTERNDNEPAFEIQRSIDARNKTRSRFKYDSKGDLQEQQLHYGKWENYDQNDIYNKDDFLIDIEYEHENYEAFYKSKSDLESHAVYLPKKLKLQ